MEPTPPPRRTRSDADRNRRTILDKASEVFQELGIKASLAEVARRSQLGIGTLYRHFAGRDELIAAIVADDIDQLIHLADQALLAKDPWDALAGLCFAQTEQGARRRVIRELVVMHEARPTAEMLTTASEFFPRLSAVVDRALAAGVLRPDATAHDFILILSGMARVVEVTSEIAPRQWRRALTLALDGMRADGGRSTLAEPSLTTPELEQGMFRTAQRNVARFAQKARTD
ncbi:TetR/AcrR family transcriptional regulator [Nakamurella silvestris]|nr:TetR/AcrR family transcriptional regulator [Nakamurella silvestris]